MGIGRALPPERREAVETLLRDTALSMPEIAARTGVNYGTVRCWNARSGQIRPPRLARHLRPSGWSPGRRAALGRLYREARNDPGDIAEVAGVARSTASVLFVAAGLIPGTDGQPPHEVLRPLDADAAEDAPTLRAQLRAHIARQIAAFDAALRGEGAAVLDSARVLRDLGGLKRLFDEVAEKTDGPGMGEGRGAERTEPQPEPDVAALRADIAERFARFVGGPDAG